jgi:hypothetical protein
MMVAVPDEMTPPDRRARQERAVAVFAGVLVLLLGLGTTVASVWRMVYFTDHWRALRAAGTAVTATVADQRHVHTFKTDRDDFRLVYDYGGRHVDVWTRCAAPTGCNPYPEPQVKVWIDPANPADFVQDAEDRSWSVGVLSYGIFTLFGVGLTGVGVLLLVAGARSGRRPAPAVRGVPPRRDGKRLGRRPARRPRRR